MWDRVKVSLWFVPLIMSISAVALSGLLGRLDARIPDETIAYSKFILSGTATEMRTIMIGFAGVILATTGIVFSLLTLPLSTVAAQFGSRLLRIFLSDRTTQLVLGTFVGTFCYCLFTALSIPPIDRPLEDLPQLSVTFGLYLSVATFASLIVLIHHISTMLQAPNIAAAAGAELFDAIKMEKPGPPSEAPITKESSTITLRKEDAYLLRVEAPGYIQFIDPEIILNLAKEKDLVIRMLRQPGQFVGRGEGVAHIWPAAKVDARLSQQLKRAVLTGTQRTPTQDIEYAINQLVEVAVRAMSPAINDPFTANTCLDYLADGLARYFQYDEIDPHFYDSDGNLRFIFEPPSTTALLSAAFDMLRHAGCDNVYVLLHMLHMMLFIGQAAKSLEVRQELVQHVRLVLMESRSGSLIESDKERIRQYAESVEMKLNSADYSVQAMI
jgi:uncharacterized membrane protein